MRSTNPVFSRRGFSRDNGQAGFTAAPAGGPAVGTNPYATNPYAPQQGTQLGGPQAPARADVMTIDDVVARTAMTLGTVVLTAVLSWVLLPVDDANLGKSYGIAIGAALIAFVFAMIQSFKRTPVPALIFAYAAFEGVFLGVISNAVSTYISPGVVIQAVLGTMAVFSRRADRVQDALDPGHPPFLRLRDGRGDGLPDPDGGQRAVRPVRRR